MGVIIPQVVTASRATGAQVIDGSLRIDSSTASHLERTPGSAGNRKIFSFSGWIKKHQDTSSTDQSIIVARTDSPSSDGDVFGCRFEDDGRISVYDQGNFYVRSGAGRIRDTNGWYHVFFSVNTTVASGNVKLYVNNVAVGEGTYTQNADTRFNSTNTHRIGRREEGSDLFQLNATISNYYVIDGQALEPTDFGFTDPLTNTWKPKKYTGTFGTNGFWLPFDGSAPIGQDQSGKGNDWTPVNFGGSVELDSPTVSGARPILNTTQGGTVAGVGVFGSRQNVGYAVTVYNDGGGNKYYIDGVKQATLTGLIRGATYTFDTTDSSNSGHPFRFSESDGGSEYTNGVAAITGTATTITIPYNSSNELYYYCTNHSGMGSSITGITTNEKLADQYASNCVLAVPFVRSTDDASAGLACTSTKKADTNSGSTATNTLSNFYNGSRDFDGSNDTCSYASVPACGSGDWTVEFWLYSESSAQDTVFRRIVSTGENATSAIQIGHIGTGAKDGGYITYTHSDNDVYAVNTSKVTDRWAHIAVVRESGSVNVYTDGIKGTTADSDSNNKTGTTWYVSGYGGATDRGRFNGKIQDLRVYPGVAKYTSNFVVPATSPDILPDTPSGVSGGSKLAKITDGAVSFDGSGDNLTIPWSTDFELGTGDFTIEYYGYSKNNGTAITWGADINNRFDLGSITEGNVRFFCRSSSSTFIELDADVATEKWAHIAAVREGTAFRLYVDGKLEASGTASDTMPNDSSNTLDIGRRRYASTGANPYEGFISNVRIIKGTALYTKNFTPPTAPLTNVTNTKLLCCQSNTSATEGAVKPGTITANGDATATNFNPFNTDIHTVRGQETGYATLNPLFGELTLSDGNLHAVGVSNWGSNTADFLMSSGKWYYEYHDVVSNEHVIGIGPPDVSITGNLGSGTPSGFGYGSETGAKYSDGGNSSYGSSWTSGDVIGVAFDADVGELSFYKNGIDQGVAFTGLTTEYVPVISINGTSRSASVNFGQKPFKFPPPDGFQPLNDANTRPVNVISRPDQYVGVTTWSGNGTSQNITGLKHKPDFVWLKKRSGGTARSHQLFDTVRGVHETLHSDGTDAQDTNSNRLTAFNRDGFAVGGDDGCNGSSGTFVGWTWKAGGDKNTFNVDDVGYATAAAAGLTAGDTAPTGASVGTKQGFSIIKYTGPNDTSNHEVPHGLSQAPDFIIAKNLDDTYNYDIYHSSLADDKYLIFTTAGTRTSGFNGRPTSTVFKTEHDYSTDENDDYIAYCWHSVPGFSKFGSFTTVNSNTVYVHLGFKPAILWIKRTGSGSSTNLTTYGSWYVNNSEMSPINPASYEEVLWLNRNYAEGKRGNGDSSGTYLNVDFLSDGFRMRGSANAEIGQPSDVNIYCAWAEVPSIDLFGGGANAR